MNRMCLRIFVLCLLALQPGLCDETKGAADVAGELTGFWRGYFLVDRGVELDGIVYHFRMKISKVGNELIGTAALWTGMTEAVARAGDSDVVSGTLLKQRVFNFNGAHSARETFRISVEGDKLTFEGQKGNYVYGANGCSIYPLSRFEATRDGPDVYLGMRQDAGVGVNAKGASGFYIWREGSLSKGTQLTLCKQKTHTISCGFGDRWHYSVYIPGSYVGDRPAPVLINHNPGGNGKPLSVVMAEKLGWIMVGLKESRNGPTGPGSECEAAAMVDLRLRFNIDSSRIYFSGFSGGSGRAGLAARNYPDNCAGTINIGGGYGEHVSPFSVPTFFIVGSGNDCGKPGAIECYKRELGRRLVHLSMHPGGHTWGPKYMHEQAIQWMEDISSGKLTPQLAQSHSLDLSRKWTMGDGKKIDGDVKSFRNGKLVIERANGASETANVDSLSEEDKKILQDLGVIPADEGAKTEPRCVYVCPGWGS